MTDADRAKDLLAFHNECQGILRVHTIRPQDGRVLLCEALTGDQAAAGLMRALIKTVNRIEQAPRKTPMLCGCCPRPLRGSAFTVCVAVPDRDDPVNGLGFALCERCCSSRDAFDRNLAAALRSIWPDMRPLMVTHPEGGRA